MKIWIECPKCHDKCNSEFFEGHMKYQHGIDLEK